MIQITHHPEDESQGIEIGWVGEGDAPEESDAMLTANLMVAVYKTMLATQGIQAIIDYVEAHEHIWSQGMEGFGPEGEPIAGFEEDADAGSGDSVKLRR